MQKIKFNGEIIIPDDMVIISKAEVLELEKNHFKGKYLTMKDFISRTNRSSAWIKGEILNNPTLIKKINIENGGFVHYPNTQSDRWLFRASGPIDFIEYEFHNYL